MSVGIFAMFEDKSENNNEEVVTIDLRECKNEGKGYKTLIPDEVYEKCRGLMKAHEELREVMASTTNNILAEVMRLPDSDAMAYPMIEIMMFTDKVDEAWESISDLIAIHEVCEKEEIDRICKKNNTTPLHMVKTKMMNGLFGKMFR